jgi:hypothetical protein
MRGGIAILLSGAALAVAGCASAPGRVQVRAIANSASKLGAGSERLAEARGQLVLGNVGLAIEGFHAALREQPDSVEAMRGLAACYDSMGRTDLSRQYYEAALAVAPHNPVSLTAFATSLDAQGKSRQAIEVRSEALQASAQKTMPLVATVAPAPASPMVVALAAMPAPVPAAAPAPAPVRVPAAAPAPAPTVAIADVGQSVTIALPPPRPAAQPIAHAIVQRDGPRLQRLSFGEVALLTVGEPAWRPTVAARTAQSTTVHWVALNDSAARPNIRLLNAARSQGLAARTRQYLLARGWRKIEIGDAEEVRDSTLVMYPAGRQTTGRSLAAQFDVRAGMQQQGEVIVVLLGRDATVSKAAQARG